MVKAWKKLLKEGKAKPLDTRAEMTTTEELASGNVIVNWDFPAELESEIAGFWVDRSDARNGITVRLNANMLSPGTRSYTDVNPIASNYYKITLQDINGNEVTSYAIFRRLRCQPTSQAIVSARILRSNHYP